MTLGDMTWDMYWYSHGFSFQEYLKEINAIHGLKIFHTIGNHDHDMRTSIDGETAGWDVVDWDTAVRYTLNIAPDYYSFNIGKVHYMVLDDIYCKNTTGGTSSDRKYDKLIADRVFAWLRKDLALVDKSTPVVVTMHAPLFVENGKDFLQNTQELAAAFDGYQATFITGHTHKMYEKENSGGNIIEFNSGAICAAWWKAGKYYPTLNLCMEGTSNGYRIMDVHGTAMTSFYKAIGRSNDYQFRVYDRNQICITPERYKVAGTKNIANFKTTLAESGSYDKASSDNTVLINVWDYNPRWKVQVIENGRTTTLSRTTKTMYDPLFILAYAVPRYRESTTISSDPRPTYHFFKYTAASADSDITVKVTDDEGRVYTQNIDRPLDFSIDTYK